MEKTVTVPKWLIDALITNCEKSYRRGFQQGVYSAIQNHVDKDKLKKLSNWRFANFSPSSSDGNPFENCKGIMNLTNRHLYADEHSGLYFTKVKHGYVVEKE